MRAFNELDFDKYGFKNYYLDFFTQRSNSSYIGNEFNDILNIFLWDIFDGKIIEVF